MAPEAKVRVPLGEHFVIDRSMGLMTGGAAILHSFVDKDKGSSLFAVTLSTLLILPRKAKTAWLFENIAPMGIVAIHTIHLPL